MLSSKRRRVSPQKNKMKIKEAEPLWKEKNGVKNITKVNLLYKFEVTEVVEFIRFEFFFLFFHKILLFYNI